MSYHHCSVCGESAVEDPSSWCGNYACCSPSYMLDCSCESAYVCVGDCADEHTTDPDEA